MKKIRVWRIVPVLLIFLIPKGTKAQETDSIPFYIQMFKITEAYSTTMIEDSVKEDTLKDFINTETDLFMLYLKKTDTVFFRIQQKDSIILAGLTVKILNPGFASVTREDAEFFAGDILHNENYGHGALMKEYVTNSYQRKKKMYYFFHISLPFEHRELQLYGFDANPFTQDDPVINAIKRGAIEQEP